MKNHPILTTLNQSLGVQLYNLQTPEGLPLLQDSLSGLPLGTVGNSTEGEIGVKVIQIAARGQTIPGFEIPTYDEMVLAYYGSTNNLHTVTYKLSGTTVATLTLTYAASGAADDDVLTGVTKS